MSSIKNILNIVSRVSDGFDRMTKWVRSKKRQYREKKVDNAIRDINTDKLKSILRDIRKRRKARRDRS